METFRGKPKNIKTLQKTLVQQNIYYSRSRSGLVWNTFKVDKRSKFGNYRNNTPLLLYILYRVDMLCTQIRDACVYNLAVLNVYVSYCCLLWVWNSLASLLWHQQDIFAQRTAAHLMFSISVHTIAVHCRVEGLTLHLSKCPWYRTSAILPAASVSGSTVAKHICYGSFCSKTPASWL